MVQKLIQKQYYSKTHNKWGGRLLILANLKTHASYFDLPFITISNFGVTSNLSRLFSENVNAETALKLSFSSCLMFSCF